MDKLAFAWTWVSFEPTILTLQLSFENPVWVSKGFSFDQLVVSISESDGNQYLRDTEGLAIGRTSLKEYVPLQLKLDAATASLESASKSAGAASQVVVIANLVMNVLLSGSLVMLWGLVNTLQVIVHLPMLRTTFPANT